MSFYNCTWKLPGFYNCVIWAVNTYDPNSKRLATMQYFIRFILFLISYLSHTWSTFFLLSTISWLTTIEKNQHSRNEHKNITQILIKTIVSNPKTILCRVNGPCAAASSNSSIIHQTHYHVWDSWIVYHLVNWENTYDYNRYNMGKRLLQL